MQNFLEIKINNKYINLDKIVEVVLMGNAHVRLIGEKITYDLTSENYDMETLISEINKEIKPGT